MGEMPQVQKLVVRQRTRFTQDHGKRLLKQKRRDESRGIDRRAQETYVDLAIEKRIALDSGGYVSDVNFHAWNQPEIFIDDPADDFSQTFSNPKAYSAGGAVANLPGRLDSLGHMLEHDAYLV